MLYERWGTGGKETIVRSYQCNVCSLNNLLGVVRRTVFVRKKSWEENIKREEYKSQILQASAYCYVIIYTLHFTAKIIQFYIRIQFIMITLCMVIPGSLDWSKSLIVITVLTMCLVSAERFSLKVSVKLPGAVSSGDHGTDIALQPLTTTQHSPTSPGREKIRACVPRTLVCKTKSNSSWFTIHCSRSMILWYTLYYVWPSLWSFYICFIPDSATTHWSDAPGANQFQNMNHTHTQLSMLQSCFGNY